MCTIHFIIEKATVLAVCGWEKKTLRLYILVEYLPGFIVRTSHRLPSTRPLVLSLESFDAFYSE